MPWMLQAVRRTRSMAIAGHAIVAVAACGATPPRAVPQPSSSSVVREGRGGTPAIAVIAQPAGTSLQLSLWIDAGTRDADPPQVASLAAWLAASAGGANVAGTAWPDAIELSTPCAANELDACVARLARALTQRRPSAAAHASARAHLVEARRAAEANDPRRAADRLALGTLFGAAADGLIPLGRASEDAHASPERVQEFQARHFGLGRLLLIAAGAIESDALARAASAAFARVPQARASRVPRASSPLESGVRVGVGDKPALSLALATADVAHAHAAALAVQHRLERDALASNVSGHVFALQERALALLRMDVREPLLALRALAHELERVRREGVEVQVMPAAADDARTLARRLAARWTAASGGAAPSDEVALGVGLVVAGGRADRLADDDPDASLQQSWQTRAQAAFDAGRALGEPRFNGHSDAQHAAGALDNGARIEVVQRASEQVAVAVRFARGAAGEPARLHGRAALLATLTTTACAGLSTAALAARLEGLGARLEPRVNAESWGLVLVLPAAHWRAGVALALDCGLHPGLERSVLSVARLRLRERLGAALGPGDLRARAAEALWPSAPGELEAWGSPVREAAVSLPALRELWRESRSGDAVAVAVVGAVATAEAVEWVGRRLCELPEAGASAATAAAAPKPNDAGETRAIAQPTLGLALWRATQNPPVDVAGAEAFAALLRAGLGRAAGVSARWHGSGVTPDGAWVAVALSGPAAQLADVAAHLREAAASFVSASLERAADQASELGERESSGRAATPAGEAESLARAPFRPRLRQANREQARALAVRLAQSEPIWLPLR